MKKILVLAGDVGGTKTNLGVFSSGAERPVPEMIDTFASGDFGCIEDMLSEFISGKSPGLAAACVAVAGPVRYGRAKVTNLPWIVETEKVCKTVFGAKTTLINDLSATAKSIPFLEEGDIHTIQTGYHDSSGAVGIMAPGTGLGVALAVRSTGGLLPVPSEGGHVDFSPTNELETELLRWTMAELGRVSLERLLSGAGLVRIYRFLSQNSDILPVTPPAANHGRLDPQYIVETGIGGQDSCAARALEIFVSMLGTAAGNLALTGLTTGGLFLAGGLSPRILPHFGVAEFLNAFCAKGRFEALMKDIPVNMIMNEHAPLLGAAVCAFETLRAD